MTVLVEVVTDGLPDRVRAERDRHGPIPLGCTVAREETALLALEAGADEAMVLVESDCRAIHALFDRTMVRATLRRQGEHLTAAIGHADKLAALGTLVAGVAHEINNPLTVVTLSTSLLQRSIGRASTARQLLDRLSSLGRAVQPEELAELAHAMPNEKALRGIERAIDDISSGVDAVTDVVRDLRVFARIDEDSAAEWLDVRDVIDQVVRIVKLEIERTAVLEHDIPADLPRLYLPRTRLVQVLTNVLINAAHAVREVERPVHRVRVTARSDEEAVAIVVADTGPGIAPEDIDRIFDPFFTTKRQGLGTGLGLSISRSILRGLGGDMLVESVFGDGASFLLMVPLPDGEAELGPPHGQVRVSNAVVGRRTVLIVGARDAMVRAYGRALTDDFDLVVASHPDEAIESIRSGTEADVVLVEGGPSDVDARAFHGWLEREHPTLATCTVFVTSDPNEPSREPAIGGVHVLRRPVGRDELIAAIERATASG